MMKTPPILFSIALLAFGWKGSASPYTISDVSPAHALTFDAAADDGAADNAPAAHVARLDQGAPGAPPVRPAPQPSAVPASPPASPPAPDPFAIRAQVLLARLRFSPGVVDGQWGSNVRHAIAAWQSARGLPAGGRLDHRSWQALLAEASSARPVARNYTLSAQDIAGPFAPDVGEDMVKLAALPDGPRFTTVIEALAERFHMSQDLLRSLNPGVTFAVAGQAIIVVDDDHPGFARGDVVRVDVSKSDASLRAYDRADKLVAFYPATVGSSDRPSPGGIHKVVSVAWDPVYTYDPARLAWGPRAAGRLVIRPGPNNPVGTVWIDLDAPTYGLHGTPTPDTVGKTASHGCVRLTNWDARALAAGVQPGVSVHFIGERGGPPS